MPRTRPRNLQRQQAASQQPEASIFQADLVTLRYVIIVKDGEQMCNEMCVWTVCFWCCSRVKSEISHIRREKLQSPLFSWQERNWLQLPFKATEEDRKEMQEVTGNLSAANEISMDAALSLAAVLSNLARQLDCSEEDREK